MKKAAASATSAKRPATSNTIRPARSVRESDLPSFLPTNSTGALRTRLRLPEVNSSTWLAEMGIGRPRRLNCATEAAGFRQALSGIAEIDALLHLAPAVLEVRQRMKEQGLKAVIQQFKSQPTSPLVAPKE